MTDNVVEFTGLFYGDMDPVEVLEKAKAWPIESVVVLGEAKNGELMIGGSTAEMKDVLWLVQRAIWMLGREEEEINRINRGEKP